MKSSDPTVQALEVTKIELIDNLADIIKSYKNGTGDDYVLSGQAIRDNRNQMYDLIGLMCQKAHDIHANIQAHKHLIPE